MHSVGHQDFIIITIVILAISVEWSTRHIFECQFFPMHEAVCSLALSLPEQCCFWLYIAAVQSVLTTGYLFQPPSGKQDEQWLNDKGLLLQHGWQVESRIRSHWELLHPPSTRCVCTKIHILHFSGYVHLVVAHTRVIVLPHWALWGLCYCPTVIKESDKIFFPFHPDIICR